MAFVAPCPCLPSAGSPSVSRRRTVVRRRPRHRPLSVTCTVAPAGDYSGWSADFLALCRTQLDLLSVTIVDISQVVLFFRQENRASGALEFVPLAVKDVSSRRKDGNNSERVWIASESGLEIPTRRMSTQLPGGVPAATILPSYPAMAAEEYVLPDGGLCVPVQYNDAVAGSICLWKTNNIGRWKAAEVTTAKVVARTISIAATMEGKTAFMGTAATAESLGTITHQMRSPITALVTFGHVLLRKLPPGHRLRQLAKSIVVEALRLDTLLAPLDTLTDKLSLTAQTDEGRSRRLDAEKEKKSGSGAGVAVDVEVGTESNNNGEEEEIGLNYDRLYSQNSAQTSPYSDLVQAGISGNRRGIDMEIAADEDDDDDIFFEDDEDDDDDEDDVLSAEAAEREVWESVLAHGDWTSPTTAPDAGSGSGGEVVWLSDVARPILSSMRILAEQRGLHFYVNIDPDAPAARVCSATDVRESIYNLLHNALAYTPANCNGSIGLVVVACQVLVWDTGPGIAPEDARDIWERGNRGSMEKFGGIEGNGIGLAVVRNTATRSHGSVGVISPLPAEVGPRCSGSDNGNVSADVNVNSASPGSVFCLSFPRATGP